MSKTRREDGGRIAGSDPAWFPPPGEPARARTLSVVEGAFATVHIQITTGSLVTAYALGCGARDLHLGLAAALTALASSGALFGSQWVGRLGRRRPFCAGTAVLGRALWGLLALAPFLPMERDARLALFFAVLFLGQFLVNAAGTAWLSWMTDLVPLAIRGSYFGLRNAVHAAVAMATAGLTGWIFDRFVAAGRQSRGLAAIFGVAVGASVVAGALLSRQWEPPLRGDRSRPLRETIRLPLADPRFRALLAYLTLCGGAAGVASGFFAPQMIRHLRMPFSQIALYPIVAGLVSLASQPLWGRLADRVGNRPVVALCQAGWSGLPFLWLLATPHTLWPIWVDAVLTGVFWPGFALASFNLLLASAPEETRTACLGVQAVAVGVATFLASTLGGLLAGALSSWSPVIGGRTWTNYHVLFATSALLRFALVPLARRLPEEGARPVSALVGFIGDRAAQELHTGIQAGLVAVRKLRRPRNAR